MCHWLESIALQGGSILHLDYHQARMDYTLSLHKSSAVLRLEQLLSTISLPSEGLYKVRVVYNVKGFVDVSWQPYRSKQWSSFELVEATDLDYATKKLDRACFDHLKSKASKEELILTQQGLVTDTTYSNLVFLREGLWFTPSSYLLKGTQRQFLLDHKQIKETRITQDDLASFTHFKLINAMMPFSTAFTYPITLIRVSERSFSSSCYGLIDGNKD
ncbi:MAG: aminotransferase class IV [Bacteroides sp.]